MKTKLLLFVFAILTVCGMQSQDTIAEPSTAVPLSQLKGDGLNLRLRQAQPDTLDTRPISFPFWMVKAIALDLEEKSRLEVEVQLLALEVETFQELLESLEKKEQKRQLQLELLGKNIGLMETRLQAAKITAKGAGTLIWSLSLLAALGAGFLLGRM